ncbi:MAG: hypothetical protein AMS27_05580 [Bacteroides sp. SM23_62_1]|nr:MAG: hypothetical protein AMS27_05580 [Bacteroides sp. SM23_62_1]
MRICYPGLILFLLIFFIPHNIIGQETVSISRISEPVDFDGSPFEQVWDNATLFPMIMYSPNFGFEPSEKSEVMICYDKDYLWIGARLYSRDPSHIVSTSKKRDEQSRNSDAFGVILDTYDDNENALVFYTTPTGSRTDYTISNDAAGGPGGGGRGGMMNMSWNTFWDVETTRDDRGWYVEMRIPFSSLRFQNVNGIIRMGMIINRRISYNNETDTYPAIDPKYGFSATMKPSLAQTIEFEDIVPVKPVYISPYVIGGFLRNYNLNEEETQYVKEDKPEIDAGLDVKYSLTSNMTLDLTANTDFAQVEADDQQINLTRYDLFFPEKRLFFQERSGIFNFSLGGPSNLFYSRSIGIVEEEQVRIYGGARLVGRAGKWDIGVMDMQTEKYKDYPSENFGIARLRRQVINPNSYVGGIFTSRLGMDGSYNVGYGMDGIFRIFGDDYVDVRLAQTYETATANVPLSTDPTFAGITWERRSDKGFAYDLSYSYCGQEFNPGIGFLMRGGIQGMNARFQYGWIPDETSKFFNYRAMMQFRRQNRVSDGGLETMEISPGWNFMTKRGFGSFIEFQYMKEGVQENFPLSDDVEVLTGEYTFMGVQGRFFTPQSKPISSMIRFEGGQFYDGKRISVEASPIFNISESIQLSGSYEFNTVDFPDRDLKLRNHITRVNFLYMYSTKLSASIFAQFNNAVDAFIANFRIRYNPREGNDFYIVYNEYRGILDRVYDPEWPPFFNRTILLKYTHTFRI